MSMILRCAAALCFVSAAAVVTAEPPVGSRLGERLESRAVEADPERAAGAHEVAYCLAGRKRKAVEQFLSATNAEDSMKFGQRLSGDVDDCMMNRAANDMVEAQRIRYPVDILRGMLAEQLIKRAHARFAQLPSLPIQKVYSRPWYAASGRNPAVNEMATCVAETNPGGVLALVQTEPYTDAEQAAFSALVPFFGPCLAAGTKLEGKREPLRAALAEALYQRVNFPAVDPAQGVAE